MLWIGLITRGNFCLFLGEFEVIFSYPKADHHNFIASAFRIISTGRITAFIYYGPCIYFGEFVCYTCHSIMLHLLSHTLYSLLLSFAYRYYILFHPTPKRIYLVLIITVVYIPSGFQWVKFRLKKEKNQE